MPETSIPVAGGGLSDEEAMVRLAQGDIGPLGDIYCRYACAVSALLWRFLPSLHRDEVDDLAQEVFLTLFETAPRYREVGKLRSWLFGIAVRKARAHTRLHASRLGVLASLFSSRRPAISEEIPSETKLDLEKRMLTMPYEQREALVLWALEGLSGEQIAEMLGVPVNTIWTRLRRARLWMAGPAQSSEAAGEQR